MPFRLHRPVLHYYYYYYYCLLLTLAVLGSVFLLLRWGSVDVDHDIALFTGDCLPSMRT